MGKKLCSIEGCTKTTWARGWCGTHYRRWHKYGSPHTVLQKQFNNPEEAFAARTEWQVLLMKNYKKYHFGYFHDVHEAGKVAAKAREELFGEYAGKG